MAKLSPARLAELERVDWAAVRRAYEARVEPVAIIASRHGLSLSDMRRAMNALGWTKRPPAAISTPLATEGAATAAAIRLKVGQMLLGGISCLNGRIRKDGLDAGTAQALVALCRAAETYMRTTRRPTKTAGKSKRTTGGSTRGGKQGHGGSGGADAEPDLARLRAELKAKLEGLRESLEPGAEQRGD